MQSLTIGKKLGDFRVKSFIAKNEWRSEYYVEAPNDVPEAEGHCFRAIVYDMTKVPEYYLVTVPSEKGDVLLPAEMFFLEYQWTSRYPFAETSRRAKRYPWIIVRTPIAAPLALQLMEDDPASERESMEMGISLCRAVEQVQYCGDVELHHFNLIPMTVLYVPDADIFDDIWLRGFEALSRAHRESAVAMKIDYEALYKAPETFVGEFSQRADVYSICLLVFGMVTGGEYPWPLPVSLSRSVQNEKISVKSFLHQMGKLWNQAPNMRSISCKPLRKVLEDGLATNPEKRIDCVRTLKARLENALAEYYEEQYEEEAQEKEEAEEDKVENASSSEGAGFEDIAGMYEWKESITDRFLLPLRHKEVARKYGVTMPNGFLLWGPSGNGKTYCVSRLAHEAGIAYRIVKPSDLGSIYIHGAQTRISELFSSAKESAPIILAFDEADAIIPDRNQIDTTAYAGETNEFLAQLCSSGEDGVYVCLMTNRPNKIDPCILRPGRIDEKFYVPLPSAEAREEFFRIRLGKLEYVGDIDYSRLSLRTEGFSFADLSLIVNEAARKAFRQAVSGTCEKPVPVTMDMLLAVIEKTVPSVSSQEVRFFESLREQYDQQGRQKVRRIGFN